MRLNKYWLIAGGYILAAFVFALGLCFGIRRLPDVSQPRLEKEVWVYSGHSVSQTIVPGHDGFNVIDIYLRNVALRNQSPFTFVLSDASGQPLRTIRLTGYNVVDGQNIRFQFDPIPDSRSRQLTFTLSSDSPENLAIGAGYSSADKSLTFRSYYYPSRRWEVISSVLSGWTETLFRLRFIAILLFLAVSGYVCLKRIEK
jgi:hypothetical protein